MKHAPHEYKAIAMWGKRMGSRSYYIEDEQYRASQDGAPIDATYRNHDTGKWVCVSDFEPNHLFRMEYEEQG